MDDGDARGCPEAAACDRTTALDDDGAADAVVDADAAAGVDADADPADSRRDRDCDCDTDGVRDAARDGDGEALAGAGVGVAGAGGGVNTRGFKSSPGSTMYSRLGRRCTEGVTPVKK